MSFKQYMSLMGGICLALIILIITTVKCTINNLSFDRPRPAIHKEEYKVFYQKPDSAVDYPKPSYVPADEPVVEQITEEAPADDSSVEVHR